MRTSQETRPGLSHGIRFAWQAPRWSAERRARPADARRNPFDASVVRCRARPLEGLWNGVKAWAPVCREIQQIDRFCSMRENRLAGGRWKSVKARSGMPGGDAARIAKARRDCAGRPLSSGMPDACAAAAATATRAVHGGGREASSKNDVRAAAAKNAAALPVMSAAEAAAAIKAQSQCPALTGRDSDQILERQADILLGERRLRMLGGLQVVELIEPHLLLRTASRRESDAAASSATMTCAPSSIPAAAPCRNSNRGNGFFRCGRLRSSARDR